MARIDSTTPVRISTNMSVQRQTPNTDFGARVKSGLDTAASAAANGAAIAAPFVPGGAILSAAVSSVSTMTNGASSGSVGTSAYASGVGSVGGPVQTTVGAGGSVGTGAAVGGQIAAGSAVNNVDARAASAGIDLDKSYQNQMQLLALQNQMQMENQTFSTLSNVMKTKHDTAKNSIANVR